MQKNQGRGGRPQRSGRTKKAHRKAAKTYVASNQYHWHRRILKEMAQSLRTVSKVVWL